MNEDNFEEENKKDDSKDIEIVSIEQFIEENSKFKIKTHIGELEFERLSGNEFEEIDNLNSKNYSDEEFVRKLLFCHLINENISNEKFQELTNQELKEIILKFSLILNLKDLNEYEGLELFKNFKNILIKEYTKNKEILSKASKEWYNNFTKNYLNQLNFDSSFYHYYAQQQEIKNSMNNLLSNILGSMSVINEPFLQNFNYFYKKLHESHPLTSTKLNEILSNNKLFITPNVNDNLLKSLESLIKHDSDYLSKIDDLFIENFFSNECENLKHLMKTWENKKHFDKRKEIIQDCLYVMNLSLKNNKFNGCNIILPTVIAQIDGLTTDYTLQLGYQYEKAWLKDNNGNNVSMNEKLFSDNPNFEESFEVINTEILFGMLFQTTYPTEELNNPFEFSRHKILHGEVFDYGLKTNVIRSFLLLDYIFYFIDNKN